MKFIGTMMQFIIEGMEFFAADEAIVFRLRALPRLELLHSCSALHFKRVIVLWVGKFCANKFRFEKSTKIPQCYALRDFFTK